MSAASHNTSRTASAAEQDSGGQDANATFGAILAEIESCLRRWKASRHEGQAVLAELSNALLLRTYVDKGRDFSGKNLWGGGDGGHAFEGSRSALWGALAHAGATVSRVSVATEARARRLHGDLSALHDAMVAAAGEIRRHAQEIRRRLSWTSTQMGKEEESHGCSRSAITTAMIPAEATASTVVEIQAGEGAGHSSRGSGSACTDGGGQAVVGGGFGLMDVANAGFEVAEMLWKEALVTATVVQGVGQECNSDNRETLMVYAASWMIQPYVNERRLKELEIMVGGRGRVKVS